MRGHTTRAVAALFGLVLCAPTFGAAPDTYHCKTRADLVGPCWIVHGRLSIYQGNPMARIWPVGTHRLLGVVDETFGKVEEFAAPTELREYLTRESNINDTIFANFQVCPLTKSKPGVMQFVCISGAQHIRVDRFSENGTDSKDTWTQLPDVGEH